MRRWRLCDFRSNSIFFFTNDSLWVIVTSPTNHGIGRWKRMQNWQRGLNFIRIGGSYAILATPMQYFYRVHLRKKILRLCSKFFHWLWQSFPLKKNDLKYSENLCKIWRKFLNQQKVFTWMDHCRISTSRFNTKMAWWTHRNASSVATQATIATTSNQSPNSTGPRRTPVPLGVKLFKLN